MNAHDIPADRSTEPCSVVPGRVNVQLNYGRAMQRNSILVTSHTPKTPPYPTGWNDTAMPTLELLVLHIPVPAQYLLLKLGGVLVPKLGGLTVQGGRAGTMLVCECP